MGNGRVMDHHLDDPAGIAQIDERDTAVVAATAHPSGQGDFPASILGAE
jgi:hypothetical protein